MRNRDAAEAVLRQSAFVTWLRRFELNVRRAFGHSLGTRALRRLRAAFCGVHPSTAVRLTGISVLTATITQAVLVSLTPTSTRPAAPSTWRWLLLSVSVTMIVAGPAIARAWRQSKTRALLSTFLYRADF